MAEGENSQDLFPEVNFDSFLDEFGTSKTNDVDQIEEKVVNTTKQDNPGQSNDSSLEETTPGDNTNEDVKTSEDTDSLKSVSDEGDGDDKKENSSPLIPYAKLLAKEGVLPNLNFDEFEKDPSTDSLKSAMLNEINQGIDGYKKTLPQEISNLLNNYEEGVPLSSLLEIDAKKAEYSSIDDKKLDGNTELQKSLLQDYYKNTTKFSEEKINKLIQRHEDLEELETEAKSSLSELVKIEETKEQDLIEEAKAEKQAEIDRSNKEYEDFKKAVNDSTEIVPGQPINDNTKNQILKVMTTPVAEDQYGRPMNAITKSRFDNPVEFEKNLAYIWLVTKNFSDFSAFKGAGKNEAINEFEHSIEKFDNANKGGFNAPTQKDNKQSGNLREAIEHFTYNSGFDDLFVENK